MLHVSECELAKLRQSLTCLETVLDTLDEIGAGIAAIHVDAAVNQLKNNLEVIGDDRKGAGPGNSGCPSEHPVSIR